MIIRPTNDPFLMIEISDHRKVSRSTVFHVAHQEPDPRHEPCPKSRIWSYITSNECSMTLLQSYSYKTGNAATPTTSLGQLTL